MRLKTEARFGALRARLGNADGGELEQALIRLAIAGMIAAYVGWYTARQSSDGRAFALASAYFAAAVAFFLAVWASPGPSVSRRVMGILIDVTIIAYALCVMGEGGVAIVGVYLFVILWNGFRYGRQYLHLTQMLSITGFAFVIFGGSWWSEHKAASVGFLYILMLIPLYVGVLAQRDWSTLD